MASLKEHQQHKRLTAAEQGDLFANYLGDSMHCVVFEHFYEVVEDQEIKEYISYVKSLAEQHLIAIEQLYRKENIPIPVGFGEEDLHRNAPKLLSDVFMAIYITQMAKAGLAMYSEALSMATRQDVIEYFKSNLHSCVETYERGLQLLLNKGVSVEIPTIPYPKEVQFATKESFVAMLTINKRPLTALEVKYLLANINNNILGKALMLAYSQVTTSQELEAYFRKGVEVADEQIRKLGEYLMVENIPTPKLLDADITDSVSPPFSDKLLLFHTGFSNAYGIQNYGTALSKILRHDLAATFALLTAKISKYANGGLELMIKNGWLEEPPTCPNRKGLSNSTAPKVETD
ncbi:DUF3231 family protein [Anaerobacillus sp. CMMVII]|uniref:DUF3231 family protein n=1 Tax=Anaerobacillus sp. CMMVII TaxID=2755588 RepID=UPI0021B7CFE8|nr:DUF3231 family protein [Anaerobacillus sp. CMMVII]MCT8137200.1 DUF3231 family protein [Anaerobacillus sp. CMMVII]